MKVSEHVTVSSEAIVFALLSVCGNIFSTFSGDFLCVAVKLFIRNPHTPTEVNSKVSRRRQVPTPRSRGKVLEGKFCLANSIHKCK